MAYIGSSAAPIPVNFSAVQSQGFNGTGSQTAFTMARSVATPSAIEVLVNNVQQSPFDGSYTVLGTTLTFSEAPSTGTNNVYVIYRDQPVGSLIDTGAVRKSGDTMTNTLRLPGIETAGSPSLLFGASKWMTQYEGTLARTYICGPDSSNYAAWEIYRATAAGSPILTMKLDSAGRVSMPYQPLFCGSRTAGGVAAGSVLVCNNVNINSGAHYNTSNGRFTAPIAGAYEFSVFFMGEQASTDVAVAMLFRINGAASPARINPYTRTTGATYVGTAGSCIFNLAAGDWVDVINEGSVPIYAIGSGHNGFSAKFIG